MIDCLYDYCEKRRNNEPCDDNIQFCEKTLAEHDEKVREEVLEEVKQIIHNIYTASLYCMDDECEDNEIRCEDCLYATISQNLKKLKEQKK